MTVRDDGDGEDLTSSTVKTVRMVAIPRLGCGSIEDLWVLEGEEGEDGGGEIYPIKSIGGVKGWRGGELAAVEGGIWWQLKEMVVAKVWVPGLSLIHI